LGEPVGAREEWAPPGALYQGALFYGESHLRKREYVKAADHFRRAAGAAPTEADHELARALVHLSAAGQNRLAGDARGFERQLAHARRRLAPYLPESRRLDLAALVALVEE
jgi:hypothetical protein